MSIGTPLDWPRQPAVPDCAYFPRKDAVIAIAALRELHLEPVMLTGDTAASAQPLAETLGIPEVYAGLSPEQKLERIRELQRRGARVLMVGDGINDAAAIAQADSGIGMGSGTELAREAGDAIARGHARRCRGRFMRCHPGAGRQ